jgi:hypothetical protein
MATKGANWYLNKKIQLYQRTVDRQTLDLTTPAHIYGVNFRQDSLRFSQNSGLVMYKLHVKESRMYTVLVAYSIPQTAEQVAMPLSRAALALQKHGSLKKRQAQSHRAVQDDDGDVLRLSGFYKHRRLKIALPVRSEPFGLPGYHSSVAVYAVWQYGSMAVLQYSSIAV